LIGYALTLLADRRNMNDSCEFDEIHPRRGGFR